MFLRDAPVYSRDSRETQSDFIQNIPDFSKQHYSVYADPVDLKVTHTSLFCGNTERMIQQSFAYVFECLLVYTHLLIK